MAGLNNETPAYALDDWSLPELSEEDARGFYEPEPRTGDWSGFCWSGF